MCQVGESGKLSKCISCISLAVCHLSLLGAVELSGPLGAKTLLLNALLDVDCMAANQWWQFQQLWDCTGKKKDGKDQCMSNPISSKIRVCLKNKVTFILFNHSFTRLSHSKKTVYMYTQYCPYSIFAYPDSCWLMSFDVTFMSLRHSREVPLSLWSPSVHSNSNCSLSFREASALSTMGRSKVIGLL